MSAKNRLRRQRQRTPLLARTLPPEDLQASAVMWDYVLRAWRSPEPPECDAGTAAMMAGCLIGQRVRVGMDVHGMTQEAATAAVLAWAEEQAAALAAAEQTREGDT